MHITYLFISLGITTLFSHSTFAEKKALAERPNIVLIVADDLGIADLSFYNNPHVDTPNLDKLAKNSVTFSDFSVTPVCATTRASLLTGKNAYKVGVSGVHGGRDYLSLEHKLIPEILQKAGYKTGMWGKWHNGKSAGYLPFQRGFDQSYQARLYRHADSEGWLNGVHINHNDWVSKVITDYAINFVNEHKQQPFFAYLSYLAPHSPWLAPETYINKYIKKGLTTPTAKLYGMIEQMDAEIGRFIDHLEKTQQLKNTIILFMSDNGPTKGSEKHGLMTPLEWQKRNALNLRGAKARQWQNGVRSPLFIYAKGRLEPTSINRFVNVTDIAPTIADMAGTQFNDHIDGYSVLPILKGNRNAHIDRVSLIPTHGVVLEQDNFNQWTPIPPENKNNINWSKQRIALRNENFKLIMNPVKVPKAPKPSKEGYTLIDIKNDSNELFNVINQYPMVAKTMKQQLATEYSKIITSPTSFQPPVHKVSSNTYSVINAYAPTKLTGKLSAKELYLHNLTSSGDGAEYSLNVEKTGRYQVFLKQEKPFVDAATFMLSSQTSNAQAVLNGELFENLGTITLTKGLDKLHLSVQCAHNKIQCSGVEKIKHIILIPKDKKLSPKSINIKNLI